MKRDDLILAIEQIVKDSSFDGCNLNYATSEAEKLADEIFAEMDSKIESCVNIANGCLDYGGGYRYNPEHIEIYHHGIKTVHNALKTYQKKGLQNTQVLALQKIGK